jgi:hypothetical protein
MNLRLQVSTNTAVRFCIFSVQDPRLGRRGLHRWSCHQPNPDTLLRWKDIGRAVSLSSVVTVVVGGKSRMFVRSKEACWATELAGKKVACARGHPIFYATKERCQSSLSEALQKVAVQICEQSSMCENCVSDW